ncbi:hypothetical protein BC830DRAFT_1153356 [Chytriomyces sp. MP71]|nr:hypothetical protein BC830DRAFT_1153356 [Chytriomyces sp. MP71]
MTPATLANFPIEVCQTILMHLHLTANLRALALSSKNTFTHLILHDHASARAHFRHRLLARNCPTLWDFLEAEGVMHDAWERLSLTYRVVVYAEMMCAPDAPVQTTEDENGQEEEERPKGSSSMWFERWPLSEKGAMQVVEGLMGLDGFDVGSMQNRLVQFMCGLGYLNVVQRLLEDPGVNVGDRDSLAFKYASWSMNTHLITLLMQDPKVDVAAEDCMCLDYAIRSGHTETVELLLSDPRIVAESFDLQLAAQLGHCNLVSLLLRCERVDASDDDFFALRLAHTNRHQHVVSLLLTQLSADGSAEELLEEVMANIGSDDTETSTSGSEPV